VEVSLREVVRQVLFLEGLKKVYSIRMGSSRKSVGKLVSLTQWGMASDKEKRAFKGVKKFV